MDTRRGLVVAAAVAGLALLAGVGRRVASRRRGWPGRGGPPPAGVREPRRPLQPSGAGAVAVDRGQG